MSDAPAMSSSPVNAQAAASKANQQAAAAGEVHGLTNRDQASANATTTSFTEGQQQPANLQQPPQQLNSGVPLDPQQQQQMPPAYTNTGNTAIDQVSNLLQNANFPGVGMMINEITQNHELSLLSKAKLVDELGADVAGLIINQLEGAVRTAKEDGEKEGQRLKEYAFQKLGGESAEATWELLQANVQADPNMSDADRKAMNDMLGAGGFKAELVIDSLVSRYAQSGNTIMPNLMQGNRGTASNFQPISRKEYQAQIGEAIKKYGEISPEVQSLRQRRTLSMQRGY